MQDTSQDTSKEDFTGKLYRFTLAPLLLLLAASVFLSLRWNMEHDIPIMLYITYLIEHFDKIPYRDIYDNNMPGSYLVYYVLSKVSFNNDFMLRLIDLALLGLISFFTSRFLKEAGSRVVVFGIVLFGIFYLNGNPYTTLQRDFFIVVLISLSLFLLSKPEYDRPLKLFMLGIIYGLCVTIKPHSGIFLAAIILFFISEGREIKKAVRQILYISAGFIILPSIAVSYMLAAGIFNNFVDMCANYLPLYGKMTNLHETITPGERPWYTLVQLIFLNGYPLLIIPAAIALYLAFRKRIFPPAQKRLINLLGMLSVASIVYMVIPGQFFYQHWLACFYFITMLASFCFARLNLSFSTANKVLLSAVCLGVAVNIFYIAVTTHIHREIVAEIYNKRVDEMASYLTANTTSSDKVLPMDLAGGVLDGMLRAERDIANPYIYDYYFYHHVSTAYIQGLRAKYLEHVRTEKPKVIIRTEFMRGTPTGADTDIIFPEMQKIIDTFYTLDINGFGYKIYKRKD